MAKAKVSLRRIRLCTTEQSLTQPTCQRGGPYVFERDAAPVEEPPHRRGCRTHAALGAKALSDLGERDVRRCLDEAEDEGLVRVELERDGWPCLRASVSPVSR